MTRLYYQGHSSFRIISEDDEVAYIDPYIDNGFDYPANLVLVTHEHFDHNNVDIVPKAPNCAVARASDMHPNGKYLTKQFGSFSVTAVPAENKNHPVDKCVGYLIEVDGKRLYFAGDTSYTDYMSDVLAKTQIDYAFLPCDGVFNMDVKEASRCAKTIGAAHTIPIHTSPTSSKEDCRFDMDVARAFEADGKIIIQPGEEVEL
ncbi:MAG: MBL fold metallo-hydrolase [Coriobacteriales bacterium]|jgi:L-ascorbate metabolism protein UlaG (beta-lactamase superfamily)